MSYNKKLIIVNAGGGLGNQMLQYAYYRKLKLIHPDTEVKIDNISSYIFGKTHNGYELDKVFNVVAEYATIKEIEGLSRYKMLRYKMRMEAIKERLSPNKHNSAINEGGQTLPCPGTSKNAKSIVRNILRIILKRIYHYITFNPFLEKLVYRCYQKPVHYVEKAVQFNKNYTRYKHIYYEGTWGNIAYYEDILDVLRKDFTFKKELDEFNKRIADSINEPHRISVSVHIRRGDYLLTANQSFNVLTKDYYQNAIAAIESLCHNPAYFIFSDDINGVKEDMGFLFRGRDKLYITGNNGDKSYIDMQLMSMCTHNIIANSTFSYWGAIIGENKNKIIVTPTYVQKNGEEFIRGGRFPKGMRVIRIDP